MWGGRKNLTLIERIKFRTLKNLVIQPIDDYGVDGDFVESQAFAYLAIRSYLKLPIISINDWVQTTCYWWSNNKKF